MKFLSVKAILLIVSCLVFLPSCGLEKALKQLKKEQREKQFQNIEQFKGKDFTELTAAEQKEIENSVGEMLKLFDWEKHAQNAMTFYLLNEHKFQAGYSFLQQEISHLNNESTEENWQRTKDSLNGKEKEPEDDEKKISSLNEKKDLPLKKDEAKIIVESRENCREFSDSMYKNDVFDRAKIDQKIEQNIKQHDDVLKIIMQKSWVKTCFDEYEKNVNTLKGISCEIDDSDSITAKYENASSLTDMQVHACFIIHYTAVLGTDMMSRYFEAETK